MVIAWHIICACCSWCCNCVLVAVNPDIIIWLLSNAEEKSCTDCSYDASTSVVAVSVAFSPKPYCPAVTAQVRLGLPPRSKKLLLWYMFFCLAPHAIFHRMCWTGHISLWPWWMYLPSLGLGWDGWRIGCTWRQYLSEWPVFLTRLLVSTWHALVAYCVLGPAHCFSCILAWRSQKHWGKVY